MKLEKLYIIAKSVHTMSEFKAIIDNLMTGTPTTVVSHNQFELRQVKKLNIDDVSFELPSDDIFEKPEVNLRTPLDEFYYYERPAYLEDDQKQFRERLQKALNYLKGN